MITIGTDFLCFSEQLKLYYFRLYMLGGWDILKSDLYQPLLNGPIYERVNGKWLQRCSMETNFKADDIIYLETVKGKLISLHCTRKSAFSYWVFH